MKAKFKSGLMFRNVVESIKELVSDAVLYCKPTGLELASMDAAHVAFVCFRIPASEFAEYTCRSEFAIGLSFSSMSKVLKIASFTDVIQISSNGTEDDNLALSIFSDEKQTTASAEFSLRTMFIDNEVFSIPDLGFDAQTKMESKDLSGIISSMKDFGEILTISITKDKTVFRGVGGIGEANIIRLSAPTLSKGQPICTVTMKDASLSARVSARYALSIIGNFVKASPLSEFVTIYQTPDQPLMIEYKIGEHGYIKFYLAPKIEEGEEGEGAKKEVEKKTDSKKTKKARVEEEEE